MQLSNTNPSYPPTTRFYSRKKILFSTIIEIVAAIILLPAMLFKKSKSNVKRILLMEPFQMGDIMSLTPLIDPLMRKYPESKIDVFTKTGGGSVLEYDSRINKVFTTDIPWSDHGTKKITWKRLYSTFKFAFKLRKYNYDIGIDTRGDVRSQALLLLAGCRTRVGYLNYLHSNMNVMGMLLTHKKEKSIYKHRYLWNVDILTAIGFSEDELFPIKFPGFIPDKLLPAAGKLSNSTVIHIGGGWKYRLWSEQKWAELINYLQNKNNDPIFVIGGSGESEALKRIEVQTAKTGQVKFMTTSLSEMVSLIGSCSLFVGLDSGPMNIASCLNIKTIALFGPGDVAMWQPINEHGRFIQKAEKFPCSPCLQIQCIYPLKNCMSEISVEDVIDKINHS
ncbi:MAG: glycosyltransferase family 9 protein [Bacteroidetes bacterium]|nr:glycosyltransferase family 9 protein [Bacteroidota bacterium]MBS1539428.1 glycosyltransferase family 9 protein [Bacteroidota bacterium]